MVNSPMRIVLQGSLGLYGVETFVHRLHYHLNRMGFDVSIAAPFGRAVIRAGKKRSIPAEAPSENRSWWRSYRDADLVHLSYALVSLPLSYILRRSPLIYTIHGVPRPEVESEPFFKLGYVLEGLALKRVSKRASRVVTISNYARDLLMKNFGTEAVVIRNGVETDFFHPPEPGMRGVLRSHLRLPAGRRTVLFVGRLHPSKDRLTLIRSIPRVTARNPHAYFVLIGDGPMRTAVEAEVSRLKVGSACRLIPRLEYSSMPAWYQVSDSFVSSAPREMLGIAVLEAMSSGLPVIASDSGGPREVLGSSGALFRSGDSVDLADKISAVIGDEKMAVEMGERSRETVIRNFRWEDVARKYADLYRNVAGIN